MWALIQTLFGLGSRSPREELEFDRRRVAVAILIASSSLVALIAITGLLLRLGF
jgi:hypothetical protein